MSFLGSIAFFLVACTATTAFGQYVTGFESPAFSSGTISGQDFWTVNQQSDASRIRTAAEIAVDLTNAGLSPDAPVHSGSQALVISGAGLSNSTLRQISGLEGETKVLLDVWTRPLTGGATGNIFMTMEDASGVRAAAFRYGPSSSIDWGTNVTGIWQASGLTWDSNSWYHLTLTVDYTTKTYDFAVGGVQVNSDPIPFYTATSSNFSQVRFFRGSNQAGMIVDDFATFLIPEPSTSLCFLLGASAMLCCPRRRNSGLRS